MTRKPKICILCPWCAPYWDPVLQEIRRRKYYDIDNYLLSAVDIAHKYNNYGANLTNYLTSEDTVMKKRLYAIRIELIKFIINGKYDLYVVFGHNNFASFFTILWCHFSRTPFVYCADSVLLGRKESWASSIRDNAIKRLLKMAGSVWIPGTATRRYMEYFGVPSDSIFEGYYCLNVDEITLSISEKRKDIERIRIKMNIPEDAFVFLMVANMTSRRQHRFLIDAFRKIEISYKTFLILVGDGRERNNLMKLCEESFLKNVAFMGNVQFKELADYFAISNAYVHTGTEPYSTAVLYAAIAGLPIITTSYIGASRDLSSDAGEPLLIEPNDIEGLSRFMEYLVLHPDEGGKLGKYLQNKIRSRSVKWGADQLEMAIEFALKGRHFEYSERKM